MARRTYSDYKAAVVHALGAEPATGVDKGRVVNDAMKHLASVRSWHWLVGGPVSLTVTQDQSYVDLPADFGEEISVTYPGSFANTMIRTDISTLEAMRANPITVANFSYYYTIISGVGPASPQTSPDPLVGLGAPRLELYPTPGTTVADALTIVYRRELKELGNDSDVPLIPEWMDYALELLCRAFAMTLEDDNPDNAPQRRFDQMLPELIRKDISLKPRRGVMRGGLYPRGYFDPFYPASVGDPS